MDASTGAVAKSVNRGLGEEHERCVPVGGVVRRTANTGREPLKVAALLIGLVEGVVVDDRPVGWAEMGLGGGIDTQRRADQ